jgi:hypothetical protein
VVEGDGTWEFIANFPAPTGNARIIRLTNGGEVTPEWVADHGSAACAPANQSVIGLQHDAAVAGLPDRTTMHRVAGLPAGG